MSVKMAQRTTSQPWNLSQVRELGSIMAGMELMAVTNIMIALARRARGEWRER